MGDELVRDIDGRLNKQTLTKVVAGFISSCEHNHPGTVNREYIGSLAKRIGGGVYSYLVYDLKLKDLKKSVKEDGFVYKPCAVCGQVYGKKDLYIKWCSDKCYDKWLAEHEETKGKYIPPEQVSIDGK